MKRTVTQSEIKYSKTRYGICYFHRDMQVGNWICKARNSSGDIHS